MSEPLPVGAGGAEGPAIDQRGALRLQLAMIAGNEPDGAFFELRYRHPRGGMRQAFQPIGRPDGIVDTIVHAGALTDVYASAAPRAREAGRADAIERVWCLWADCDGEASVKALDAFRPRPSMIIRTGSGPNVHAWWALRDPLTAEHARRANRRLAHHLGADMRSTDPARILRPAGTSNHKHDPPQPVVCERVEMRSFDAREIVGGLPDPPTAKRPTATVAQTSTARGHDSLLTIPASTYVPSLTGRPAGRDGKVRCPFHADGQERTPSLQVYDDPDRGWVCFGACDRGGSIIDFGALLWGIEPRGRGYHEIRRRLAVGLGIAIPEAA